MGEAALARRSAMRSRMRTTCGSSGCTVGTVGSSGQKRRSMTMRSTVVTPARPLTARSKAPTGAAASAATLAPG